jgi:hypothetical protein
MDKYVFVFPHLRLMANYRTDQDQTQFLNTKCINHLAFWSGSLFIRFVFNGFCIRYQSPTQEEERVNK